MSDSSKYFASALQNMTKEVAYAAAVRHLVDLDYTIPEILRTLTYPAPESAVRDTAFKYMLDSGLILENNPSNVQTKEFYDFVEEEGKFGKKSFRRVKREALKNEEEYLECPFGLFSDEQWKRAKAILNNKDYEYIANIPWKKKVMYHKVTPRMKRICNSLTI